MCLLIGFGLVWFIIVCMAVVKTVVLVVVVAGVDLDVPVDQEVCIDLNI